MEDTLFHLLWLAEHGERDELERELELATRSIHQTSTRGMKLSETEKCLDEALWYARAGEYDEALYRLQQAEAAFEEEGEEEYA